MKIETLTEIENKMESKFQKILDLFGVDDNERTVLRMALTSAYLEGIKRAQEIERY